MNLRVAIRVIDLIIIPAPRSKKERIKERKKTLQVPYPVLKNEPD